MAQSHSNSSTARTKGGIGFIIAGLVLVLLAALTAFFVAPKLTQLPGDFTSTVTYEGESWQLDPATLQLGEESAPASAVREIEVVETDGSTAVIHSVSTATLPTGESVTDKTFAVDRTDYSQQEHEGVDDQQDGMVISHVRNPDKDDFTVYDATTDTAQTVSYVETTTVDGREVYYFEGTTEAPVAAEGTLETLRAAVGSFAGTDGTVLPTALVSGFAAQVDGPEGEALRAALAAAGDELEATYVSENTTQVWIDTTMGSPIKMGQDQTVSLHAGLGADRTVPLMPLNRLQLMTDEDTSAELADTAASNASKISLVQVYLPIALAVIGLVLVGVGVLRSRRAPADS